MSSDGLGLLRPTCRSMQQRLMALSGNLINITPGTLVLLGIAGAAGLITAAAAGSGQTQSGSQQSQTSLQSQNKHPPRWADLVRDDTDNPEVTRLQMLFFT